MWFQNLFRHVAHAPAGKDNPAARSLVVLGSDDFYFESDDAGTVTLHLSCAGLILTTLASGFLMLLLLAIAL